MLISEPPFWVTAFSFGPLVIKDDGQQQQQLGLRNNNLHTKASEVFLRTKVRFLFYCLRLYYDSIFFF